MGFDRRDFMEILVASGAFGALGATGALAATPAAAEALEQGATAAAVGGPGTGNAFGFWNNYYAAHAKKNGAHDLFGAKPTPGDSGLDNSRQISFLNYDDTQKSLRFAQSIATEELPNYPGDVAMNIDVGGIRLSQEDRQTFQNLQSAQLRVDLAQNEQMEHVNDLLAWASIASIFLGESKVLPALQDLTFSPASTKQILLPGGSGMMGLNVSMTQRDSSYYTFLKKVVPAVGKFAPIVGLPAVSISALMGVYQIFGLLENRTTFLFQTAAPQKVFTTQSARQAASTTMGMNIVSGDYIAVPQKYTSILQSHLGDYQLKSNYLIPKDADTSKTSIDELANQTLPTVSYLTLNLKVNSTMQVGAPSAPAITGPDTTTPAKKAPPKSGGGSSTGTTGTKSGGGGGGWF